MQVNPKSVKSHFEKSMDKYDENAIVQKFLAEVLAAETAQIHNHFGKILELGCGTGLLTEQILKKITFNSYAANDLSEKSKKYLDKLLKNYTFIRGNASKIPSSRTYDLIISNAMFQWFTNLGQILENYAKILNSGGILAFTTFSPENFPELKTITGLSLDYKSEDELKEILQKNYKILKIETFKQVLEFSTPLELLYHLKNTGVNSLGDKKWDFSDVKNFCKKYLENFDKVTLTYTPILVIAQKLD